MKRIGPRMQMAVDYVSRHQGSHPCVVASRIGPNHSVSFGLQSVKRAIAAGLLVSKPDPKHKGRSFVYTPGFFKCIVFK